MPGTRVNKIWVLLLALPLAACVEAPSTTPSQVEIAPQRLGLGADAAPRPDAEWWKAFGDPQLDRLVTRLLANNPTLHSALARIRAAQAELSVARTGTYPSINIDGSETRSFSATTFSIPVPWAAPGNGWAMSRRGCVGRWISGASRLR